MEAILSTCNIEADVRIDSFGEGYLTHQELTQGALGECTYIACLQSGAPTGEGHAWSFYMQETEVAGQGPREEAVIMFCIAPNINVRTHCTFAIPLTQLTTHRYRISANDLAALGSDCEYTGIFEIETPLGLTGEAQAEQNIEIRHT